MRTQKQNLIDKQRREAFEKAVLLEEKELLIAGIELSDYCLFLGCTCKTKDKCSKNLRKYIRRKAEANVRGSGGRERIEL